MSTNKSGFSKEKPSITSTSVLMKVLPQDKRQEPVLTNVHKHQQKATSVITVGQLINLPLLKTAVSTFAMSTKWTEWLIAIQLVGDMAVQKNYFSLVGSNNTELLYHSNIMR
jgi:hypothetical protein